MSRISSFHAFSLDVVNSIGYTTALNKELINRGTNADVNLNVVTPWGAIRERKVKLSEFRNINGRVWTPAFADELWDISWAYPRTVSLFEMNGDLCAAFWADGKILVYTIDAIAKDVFEMMTHGIDSPYFMLPTKTPIMAFGLIRDALEYLKKFNEFPSSLVGALGGR